MITWDAYPAVPEGTRINPATGRTVKRPAEPPSRVARVIFDSTGRRLMSVPASKFNSAQQLVYDPVKVWDNTGGLIQEFEATGVPGVGSQVSAAFFEGGDQLAIVHSVSVGELFSLGTDVHGVATFWDLNTKHSDTKTDFPRDVTDVASLPDGRLLLATPSAVLQLAADRGGALVQVLGRPRRPPKATRLAVSPDGDHFAAVGKTRATIWASDGTALAHRDHSKSPQNGPAAFRPRSSVLAVAHGTVIDLWDFASGSERTLVGHKRPVWAIGFGPDGRIVYTAASDGVVIAWDADSGAERQKFDFGTGKLYSGAVSPDGLTLALGGDDGRITIVDLEE